MKAICGLVLAVCLVLFAGTLIGVVLQIVDGRGTPPLLLSAALLLIVFGGVGALSLSYLRRSS